MERLLTSQGFESDKATTCSMSPTLDVAKNDHIQVNQEGKETYRSIIGGRRYLAIKRRLDIALSASVLGQFVDNPTQKAHESSVYSTSIPLRYECIHPQFNHRGFHEIEWLCRCKLRFGYQPTEKASYRNYNPLRSKCLDRSSPKGGVSHHIKGWIYGVFGRGKELNLATMCTKRIRNASRLCWGSSIQQRNYRLSRRGVWPSLFTAWTNQNMPSFYTSDDSGGAHKTCQSPYRAHACGLPDEAATLAISLRHVRKVVSIPSGTTHKLITFMDRPVHKKGDRDWSKVMM